MKSDQFGTAVSAQSLTEGDAVWVRVNNRAYEHLGANVLRATVEHESFDVVLRFEGSDGTNTWHTDTGYLMGYHDGLGRHSDIGKVVAVYERDSEE